MPKTEHLTEELRKIKALAYDQCALLISDFAYESENKSYKACSFTLNGLNIRCRTAKITPKKVGQFVTFWKRNNKGISEPFKETDPIDFYLINLTKDNRIAQFIFPKSILLNKGILSSSQKAGKRGFRVYPAWDTTNNKQAEKTQKWQLNYFVEYDSKTDLNVVKNLLKE